MGPPIGIKLSLKGLSSIGEYAVAMGSDLTEDAPPFELCFIDEYY